MEVFSYELLPIILNTVTTDVIFNNVEKILSNSYWKDQLMRMEIQTQSSSEYSWQQLFQRNHEQLDILNCHGSYLSKLSTWLTGIAVFRKYVNKPLWMEKRWYPKTPIGKKKFCYKKQKTTLHDWPLHKS